MKYRNTMFCIIAGLVSITTVNAMKSEVPKEELDINKLMFIEESQDWELGFDTALYLPENFDPYNGTLSLKAINFMDECDQVELGFDTSEYLPEDFDPYLQ